MKKFPFSHIGFPQADDTESNGSARKDQNKFARANRAEPPDQP